MLILTAKTARIFTFLKTKDQSFASFAVNKIIRVNFKFNCPNSQGKRMSFFLPQITRIITNFSYSKNKNTLIVSVFDRFLEYYNFQIGDNS